MKILCFAQVREAVGAAEADLSAADVDEAGLWELLISRWPALAPHRPTLRLARNGHYAEKGAVFRADDEVALLPPVSGG